MSIDPVQDTFISVSYYREKESVSSSRYQWDCLNRGQRPFVILQWTHSGEGRYENEQGTVAVPRDHAFVAIVPESVRYYYPPESGEPWVFTWLNFYGELGCSLFKAFQSEFGPIVMLSSRGAAAVALRRLIQFQSKSRQPDRGQTSLLAYAFILEWWREAAQPPGNAEMGLDRAIRFCHEHFREQHGIKEIAHEAGMSREHFSRLFAQRMKETPAAFLRRLRVSEAATLLGNTRLPMEEVAMRSGFYSSRHLMRAFQRAHRENPTAYRQRIGRRKGDVASASLRRRSLRIA